MTDATYQISVTEAEKNLLAGSLLHLKADLISERADYGDVSELLDKVKGQRPLQRVKREAR